MRQWKCGQFTEKDRDRLRRQTYFHVDGNVCRSLLSVERSKCKQCEYISVTTKQQGQTLSLDFICYTSFL